MQASRARFTIREICLGQHSWKQPARIRSVYSHSEYAGMTGAFCKRWVRWCYKCENSIRFAGPDLGRVVLLSLFISSYRTELWRNVLRPTKALPRATK